MNSKIVITFDYNGLISNTEMELFKPISYIKEKANSIFYSSKDAKLKILYNGKDLKDHENQKICDYFLNKPKIKLKVIKDEKSTKELSSINHYPTFDYQTLGISYARSSSLEKFASDNLSDSINPNSASQKLKLNEGLSNKKYKCKCGKENISFLCRNCNLLICSHCKVDVSFFFLSINYPIECP